MDVFLTALHQTGQGNIADKLDPDLSSEVKARVQPENTERGTDSGGESKGMYISQPIDATITSAGDKLILDDGMYYSTYLGEFFLCKFYLSVVKL